MTDKMTMIVFVILWTIVIAVADMNWPTHMGGSSGGIVDTIFNLI